MSQPNTPPCLDVSIDGSIARITFNNPAARNAMTWPMYEELKVICDSLAKNASVRVAIFRGAGDKAFVSGSDIEQFVHLQKDEAYEVAVDAIFSSLQQLPFPTIALIEGLAVGSGLLIATACDLRISTPDARFGIPVARTLGNCLSPSNLAWLSAHLGTPMVKKMLLTSERGAEESADIYIGRIQTQSAWQLILTDKSDVVALANRSIYRISYPQEEGGNHDMNAGYPIKQHERGKRGCYYCCYEIARDKGSLRINFVGQFSGMQTKEETR